MQHEENEAPGFLIEPVKRASRDIMKAARKLGPQEARFLVDAYYMMQEDRKRASNQVRALGESDEPNSILHYLSEQSTVLENQIKLALDHYTKNHPVGEWLRSIDGIGPVIAAGLLAYVNIEKAPTAGHIWRIAGLDPTVKWLSSEETRAIIKKYSEEQEDLQPNEVDLVTVSRACDYFGRNVDTMVRFMTDAETGKTTWTVSALAKAVARRPWDGKLKTLCWKIGESFVKGSGRDTCHYGKWYLKKKAEYVARNMAGDYATQAAAAVEFYGKDTEAYKHVLEGRLPPAQIQARAKRWTVKLFLSHFQNVWYEKHYGKPAPMPYPIAILGHAHYIAPIFATEGEKAA
jgi:hypothetical protein